MLLSMTGFGEAHYQQGPLSVSIEVRTVNSRYLKMSIRTSEGYGSLDPQIDSLVRKQVRRGAIQLNLRVDRAKSPQDYTINADVLDRYRQQIETIQAGWGRVQPVPVEGLLLLPGVVGDEETASANTAEDWPLIKETLDTALGCLNAMRTEEGRAMAADLEANCQAVADSLKVIEQRAPLVVQSYRTRLEERLNKTLADFKLTLEHADILKEVGLFADRCDISEEIVRLQSHLEQFGATMRSKQSSGRKLEFLTQEMNREVNTIGSKASDVEISREVIEIKAALERIREMIQNVE